MSVLAPSAGILWRIIESYGMDPEPMFKAQGFDLEWPIEPGTRLSYESLDRVRAHAAEKSGDEFFGLRAAQVTHPSQLGALGYAWLASDNLYSAFERMHRYVRVLNDRGHFDLRESGDLLIVTLSVAQDSLNARVRDDAQLAYLVRMCRMNAGAAFNPQYVSFRHAAPDEVLPYEELFRAPVRFGSQHNEMALTLEQAKQPLPTSNPLLAQMNERVAKQRLASLDANDIPNRVRGAIMDQLSSGEVSDESVAEELHMTSRTLHRKLKQHDVSFRSLLKDVRRDLAMHYIADESLTLTEITFLLGFSEMSSFSRAFKTWNGISPSEARANAVD